VYESLGLRNVETYIQSGNVVFRTSARSLDSLALKLEGAILRDYAIRTMVMLRTCEEWRDVIARNPFAGRTDIDPAKLLVSFLASRPGDEACHKARQIQAGGEELCIDGRHLYLYYVNGLARPKLSMALLDKALATSGTGRNWNTVVKLLEIAERLEGAS
jgi:uncharacterized protein (DUF1697 family)